MFRNTNIVEIYFVIDEFNKEYEQQIKGHMLTTTTSKKRRNKPSKLNDSEVMTILVLFHLSGYRTLKDFYLYHVRKHMKREFPQTVSYNRFVELQTKVIPKLLLFLELMRKGDVTGISFVDSTPIKVCTNKRISSHKVFKGLAAKGKSSIGWFYGFKLHLIINDKGEIISFILTPANVDDREPLKNNPHFIKDLWGKLFGDKGYISKDLFEKLFSEGIELITSIKNNMKNKLMDIMDKLLLRKRSIVETVNDELKNYCQIEHSRHRSPANFLANLIAGLIAYSFLPKKPSLKFYDKVNDLNLILI